MRNLIFVLTISTLIISTGHASEGLSRQISALKTSLDSFSSAMRVRLDALESTEAAYQICSSARSLYAPKAEGADQNGCLPLPSPSAPVGNSLSSSGLPKANTGNNDDGVFQIVGARFEDGTVIGSMEQFWAWSYDGEEGSDQFKEIILEGRERYQSCRSERPRCPAVFDNPRSIRVTSPDQEGPFWVNIANVSHRNVSSVKIRMYHPSAATATAFEVNGVPYPRALGLQWDGRILMVGQGGNPSPRNQSPSIHILD